MAEPLQQGEDKRPEPPVIAMRTVTIPGSDQHDGMHSIDVTLPWACPECGGPRGEPFKGISYDGSRRLSCDSWDNPCGHVDGYAAVREEARAVGARRIASATVAALARLLAGTLRDGIPDVGSLAGRSAVELAGGLDLGADPTLAEAEAALRAALGMPAREGLPDCDACGQSLGVTADGLCTSCAATAMLGTILHPEQHLGPDDGEDDDLAWYEDGEEQPGEIIAALRRVLGLPAEASGGEVPAGHRVWLACGCTVILAEAHEGDAVKPGNPIDACGDCGKPTVIISEEQWQAEQWQAEHAPVAECGYCTTRITLLGGHWTDDDGTTACTDTSAPYVPHKPKEC